MHDPVGGDYPRLTSQGARRKPTAEVALDMLCISKRITYALRGERERRPISLKVGLNTGRVICGVVGTRRPQYSLYGSGV